MPEIVERREVVVRDGERELAFIASPDDGELTILDRGDAGDDEVCAIRLGDREELTAFLEGLRRVLLDGTDLGGRAPELLDGTPRDGGRGGGPSSGGGAPSPPPRGSSRRPQDGEDREERIERARQRHSNAFAAWTRDEEQRLLDAHRDGTSVADLARAHGRSQRAIEMRLEKLGATDGG